MGWFIVVLVLLIAVVLVAGFSHAVMIATCPRRYGNRVGGNRATDVEQRVQDSGTARHRSVNVATGHRATDVDDGEAQCRRQALDDRLPELDPETQERFKEVTQAYEVLRDPEKRAALKRFLAEGNYYVFTINGFPYGAFHGRKVKEDAYRPDWSEPERLAYTDHLAGILAELLPAGQQGSVSTVPCTFKPWAATWLMER